MNKTKIEWCDYTWNPATGCYHGCPYCYARVIANRFKAKDYNGFNASVYPSPNNETMQICELSEGDPRYPEKTSFPYGFMPTLYHSRLNDPAKVKKRSRVFVCSMADLFGKWVPNEWLWQVYEACGKADWHTYFFLTKNPGRYAEIYRSYLDYRYNLWFGATVTKGREFHDIGYDLYESTGENDKKRANRFLSIEPLLGEIEKEALVNIQYMDWIIIGALTPKPQHDPKWVQAIIAHCRMFNVPLFLKDNLKWPEKIQEFPEVARHD